MHKIGQYAIVEQSMLYFPISKYLLDLIKTTAISINVLCNPCNEIFQVKDLKRFTFDVKLNDDRRKA